MSQSNPEPSTEATEPRPASFTGDPSVEDGRFAVYDETLLRYVGPVTDRKPTDRAIRELVGDHPHSVHQV